MDFIPVEEAQGSMEAPWDMAEKEAKDFFREEWVEEPKKTMLQEDLEEVEVHMEVQPEGVLEVEEATLGEVAGIMNMTPVEEGEDLTTPERISRMNAVIIQLGMVR